MAKVSDNSITSMDQDWGYDSETGLPYSGQAVQDFIKDTLDSKVDEEEVEEVIGDYLNTNLFSNGTGTVVTAIEGNSNAIQVSAVDSSGNTSTTTIDISTADVNDRFVAVLATLSSSYINVAGQVSLAYGFTVTDYQGELIDNSYATASLSLSKQGSSNAFYTTSLGTIVSASDATVTNQEVDITNAVSNNISSSATVIATLTITYTYTYTDDDGETQSKTINKVSTSTLTVLALTLTTSVNISNTSSGQFSIPYTVKGNGSKTVYLYKNGVLEDYHDSITASSSSNSFVQTLSSGSTNYQLVAETTAGDTVVTSSSFYFDLMGGTSSTLTMLLVEDTTGTIQSTNYATPSFNATKFTDFTVQYFTYTSKSTTTEMVITTEELDSDGNVLVSTDSDVVLSRTIYTYSKRIKSSNQYKVTFAVEDYDYSRYILINPLTSSINIELPTESLVLDLDADGRSNEESNPAVWKYGSYTTEFSGVNWSSNGWIDNALVLKNGAKATINFPLFEAVNNYSVTKEGCAFEILFKCSNATFDEEDIITCYWTNDDGYTVGLRITTQYAGVNTGEFTEYTDDDGNVTQSEETRVGTTYAQDEWYKFIFVIDPDAPSLLGTGLCKGYINGIMSYVCAVPSSFMNISNLPIVIDSTYADVYVKSIKYYNAPLTHDQCTDEYIIDQDTASDIETLYNNNDVLAEDEDGNSYVSPAKLREMGHGVVIISPSKSQTSSTTLQDLNASTDKKSYFGPFRVAYYAPTSDINLGYSTTGSKGDAYNFLHTECAIRVQGTTSTKRPRKNYRLHLNKATSSEKPSSGSFIVGGEVNTSYKYSMSENAVAVPLLCLKTDYVDSSMTHNTASALVFNELTRNVEALRNPAQEREYSSSVTDITTRVAVEGFPIDVFAASGVSSDTLYSTYTTDLVDSDYTDLEYMGQYNFNNDKSKSGAVFGFDGAYLYDENGDYAEDGAYQPICMEFLDNNAALDLFHVTFNSDNEIDEDTTYSVDNFGDALEVRAPEDITDAVADDGLDSLKSEDSEYYAYSYVPDMIKEVFNFVGTCAKEVAENNGFTAYDLNSMSSDEFEALDWTSETFAANASEHFNMDSVCGWYIWTDYLLAVDQRAKNMMMYTMDGSHWMFQYYDGDTALGERNDCFLAYDYLTDRDTWDSGVQQYALQGHDSWLWYLVRANFEDNLVSICQTMRDSGKFSADYLNQIFNGQFVASWSERQYNYSQQYKYIDPLSETGYPSDIGTNFINTAQGSREAHRTYFIENRFSLLDSKYRAGSYTQDAFVYYAAAGSVNTLTIVSSIPYYFGWNTSNTSIQQHVQANADNDYTVELSITGNSANNPANVLGASRIKELTFSSDSSWMVDSTKTFSLENLQTLIAANMSSGVSGDLYIGSCPALSYMDLSSSNFSGLVGISSCSKLNYLNVEDTGITSITLPDGAPVATVKLATAKVLYMSNLESLYYTDDTQTLSAQDWTSLSSLAIINCPNIDWEAMADLLIASTASSKHLIITGIDVINSIDWLDKFDGILGLDESGVEMSTAAQLVGTLTLTSFVDDDVLAEYQEKYPNLTINQPQYTVYCFDDSESDPANITNYDNQTGYEYGNDYVASGHAQKIREAFIPVRGKLNTETGDWEGVKLSTADYTQLADGNSWASTYSNDDDYDSMKYMPPFWLKGVNDYINSKKYVILSSNTDEPESTATAINRQTLADIVHTEGALVRTTVITVGTTTLDDITLTTTSAYNTYLLDVAGMKQVRWPGMNSSTYGAAFFDEDGVAIETFSFSDDDTDFVNGEYLFTAVPDGAVSFLFSSATGNDDLEAIAVDSEEVEAIEPDWVQGGDWLCGIYQMGTDGFVDTIRSTSGMTVKVGNGTSTTGDWTYDEDNRPTVQPTSLNYTCKDFMNAAMMRGEGYQCVDYEMSKEVALLWMCLNGTRDVQTVCGYGKSAGGSTGYSDSSWPGDVDSEYTSSSGNKCLGLESWYGCTFEWMENVAVNIGSWEAFFANKCIASSSNGDSVDKVWHIYDPVTQTERTVQGVSFSGYNIKRVKNGRYCDVIASLSAGDTTYATYYCDGLYYSASTGRVVGRSYNGACAFGGLVYAGAYNVSSYSSTYCGSRLAFRGSIVIED